MLNFKPKNIVILTGAGISAESGISTFRDKNGLWENHDVMDVASPSGFDRNPELVHKFYNQRRNQLNSENVIPNAAHKALAKLEEEFEGEVTIITQNVDNLHERAGSNNVIHMHGELMKMRCVESGKILLWKSDLSVDTKCPCCFKKGNLRPHIVWFGEFPLFMDKIEKKLNDCDLFISIGTSGQVYPAAMFVNMVKANNQLAIEANIEETNISESFDFHLTGKASEVITKLVSDILAL